VHVLIRFDRRKPHKGVKNAVKAIASLDQRIGPEALVDLCGGVKQAPGISWPELLMAWIPPLIQNVRNISGNNAASVNGPDNQVVSITVAHVSVLVSIYPAIQLPQVVI
tara:strand:+ start:1043 stop:1369 length:327 start_codon:yes stop_codon:yes gene_type:complete